SGRPGRPPATARRKPGRRWKPAWMRSAARRAMPGSGLSGVSTSGCSGRWRAWASPAARIYVRWSGRWRPCAPNCGANAPPPRPAGRRRAQARRRRRPTARMPRKAGRRPAVLRRAQANNSSPAPRAGMAARRALNDCGRRIYFIRQYRGRLVDGSGNWLIGVAVGLLVGGSGTLLAWSVLRPRDEARAGIEALAGASWREFLNLVLAALASRGYRRTIDRETASGDADFTLEREGRTWLLSCKHARSYVLGK